MPGLGPITIDDTTGSTVAIPAYTHGRQAILRITGDRVWINFNEAAVVGQCEYLDAGDECRFWGDRATADVYLVCDTGLSATGYVVEGATNMEIVPGLPRESNGGIPVNIQDQHTRAFDVFFSQVVGSPTTLATDAVINEWTVALTAGHGAIVGDQLVIYDIAADRLYIGEVLVVATNVITLDTPINYDYLAASSVVARATRELNVNGAVARQTFAVSPPITSPIDITRIMIQMTTDGFPEMDMFGDIAAGLTRGLVLRVVNGINVNYFNVKTNGDLVNLMYDVNFYDAEKHGTNGLGGRLTYAGPSKHGVTIRLETDDSLELIIQDDLRSLIKFRVIASGHVVED